MGELKICYKLVSPRNVKLVYNKKKKLTVIHRTRQETREKCTSSNRCRKSIGKNSISLHDIKKELSANKNWKGSSSI